MAGNTIGQSVPDGYLTAGEFCSVVGISRSTLNRWLRLKYLVPADTMMRGQLEVALFDRMNIEEAKKIGR